MDITCGVEWNYVVPSFLLHFFIVIVPHVSYMTSCIWSDAYTSLSITVEVNEMSTFDYRLHLFSDTTSCVNWNYVVPSFMLHSHLMSHG